MGHMTKHNPVPGDPTREEPTIQQPEFSDPFDSGVETTSLPVVSSLPEQQETPPEEELSTEVETTKKKGGRAGKKIQSPPEKVQGSLAGSTWVALIVGLLLLILLIVFIMQNQQQVQLNLFTWSFQFPAGIGYLITAITGGLIVAMVGGVRMLELRRQVRKAQSQQH